jgi:hypothetical protein
MRPDGRINVRSSGRPVVRSSDATCASARRVEAQPNSVSHACVERMAPSESRIRLGRPDDRTIGRPDFL